MVSDGGEKVFKPMRYQVRPEGSKQELGLSLYNARLSTNEKDGGVTRLGDKRLWGKLFMRRHGLFPFVCFFEQIYYEDVEFEDLKNQIPEEKKERANLVAFAPKGREIMWAPVLWDSWLGPDGKHGFNSFAIITDEPPEEIKKSGHDRCPIFLKEDAIEQWLNPQGHDPEEYYEILAGRESVYFNHYLA
jgi:putative SOS response-associated peptidase YedK